MSLEHVTSRRAALDAMAEMGAVPARGDAARVCAAAARFKKHHCVMRACVDFLLALPAWDDAGYAAVASLAARGRLPAGAASEALRRRLAAEAPHFVWMMADLGIDACPGDFEERPAYEPAPRGYHLLWPYNPPS